MAWIFLEDETVESEKINSIFWFLCLSRFEEVIKYALISLGAQNHLCEHLVIIIWRELWWMSMMRMDPLWMVHDHALHLIFIPSSSFLFLLFLCLLLHQLCLLGYYMIFLLRINSMHNIFLWAAPHASYFAQILSLFISIFLIVTFQLLVFWSTLVHWAIESHRLLHSS